MNFNKYNPGIRFYFNLVLNYLASELFSQQLVADILSEF